MVPSDPFAAVSAQQIEDQASQQGHVVRRMTGAGAALVLAEGDAQDPVQ